MLFALYEAAEIWMLSFFINFLTSIFSLSYLHFLKSGKKIARVLQFYCLSVKDPQKLLPILKVNFLLIHFYILNVADFKISVRKPLCWRCNAVELAIWIWEYHSFLVTHRSSLTLFISNVICYASWNYLLQIWETI